MFKFLIIMLLWLLLIAVSWPLAVLALVLFPIGALIVAGFSLLMLALTAAFFIIKSIFLIPAYLVGWRPQAS